MTHKELFNLLQTLQIPVAYDHFNDDKMINPPFIVYRDNASTNFKADNKTYFKDNNFTIELITNKKDLELQGKIETLLDTNNIPYDSTDEIWDNNEKIYHNFYEI